MWLYKADLKSSGSTICRVYYCCVWSVLTRGVCPPRKIFDSRLSEIISDVISGVKEQELLQIRNLAIVLASRSR